ncbi:MAG: polymerase sigma-70 factor, subfamily, partial [Actinomycetota bacterium]|nr:polymerase sigma-70 factor, subfamily [Actinomycetota bacterium]
TDHFKSSRFRLEVSIGDMLDADRADEGIEGAVLDQLRNAELLGAVKQLKPEQQECIVLRFLQGLSVAETADVMQRTDGAIKQLQLRAVRALAKLIPDPAT